MTLLMFHQSESFAILTTDTLVTDSANGNAPAMYRSKVWSFPHLNLAMAVTGIADLGDVWNNVLRRAGGVRDIEGVNASAPEDLTRIFADLQEFYSEDIGTATVYLFGFPHNSNQMVRYIYRSPKGFESERHVDPGCFAAKPPPQKFDLYIPANRDEVIEMAERLREENGDGTGAGTVAIGGELFQTLVENGRIHTDRIYRFPDYEETWARMPLGVI